MKEFIKLGFGFYIGYELAKTVTEIVKEAYQVTRKRIEKGSC